LELPIPKPPPPELSLLGVSIFFFLSEKGKAVPPDFFPLDDFPPFGFSFLFPTPAIPFDKPFFFLIYFFGLSMKKIFCCFSSSSFFFFAISISLFSRSFKAYS